MTPHIVFVLKKKNTIIVLLYVWLRHYFSLDIKQYTLTH
jgi:hypothetical protein